MQTTKVYPLYFSATGTTRKVVKQIAEGTGLEVAKDHAFIRRSEKEVCLTATDLAVVGIPVYAGRVPAVAAENLKSYKGNNTPAIIIAVYGNRAYEDALLELKDILQRNGFRVIAAGAFVAEHSIFPAVATGRPDGNDLQQAMQFGRDSLALLSTAGSLVAFTTDIQLPGNHPYRPHGAIPLKPRGNRRCNRCGACVKACPVQAIPEDHPRRTDKSRCISCAHCIAVCPEHSRHFGGFIYLIARRKFTAAHSEPRQVTELFFASL